MSRPCVSAHVRSSPARFVAASKAPAHRRGLRVFEKQVAGYPEVPVRPVAVPVDTKPNPARSTGRA